MADRYDSGGQTRQARHRGPEKLSNILADLIIERGYARQLTASHYQEAWRAVVSGPLAAGSRPGRLKKGILEITVRNSMVMQELTFQKKQIIRGLNTELEQNIVDLRFRVGTID